MARALIVVDVQNDFCEGGSLPVAGGAQVAHDVAEALRARTAGLPGAVRYDRVVATKDHHIDPGPHFGDPPDYVDSWPKHCVVGTGGEAFHPNLDPEPFDAIFRKGEHRAAYSGFEGATETGDGLETWLRAHRITEVDVCGIATDHCVRATALDARRAGFRTRVLTALVAGVAPDSTERALAEMTAAGIELV
ncbi:nicotinamidase [Nocardioides nematodiphilus]|uniref:nicotinamidase n=1 Tax=Nocardioides nematodiphilus TaxID=2849669 RepID=UPI001CDA15A7|nr:nicotinamidase [Nocardioides nematodiphilus]MCA1984172.1 nicotinamidase [Nocardioides nematodiphilus]